MNNQDTFGFAVDPVAALDRKIAETLKGERGAYPLPPDARELLRILQWHKGASHARPLEKIATSLHASARDVKATVKLLVEDFEIPIGASRQEPYGYFLCVTQEDYDQALRPLVNELISIARRVRALASQERRSEVMGQLQLELNERKVG